MKVSFTASGSRCFPVKGYVNMPVCRFMNLFLLDIIYFFYTTIIWLNRVLSWMVYLKIPRWSRAGYSSIPSCFHCLTSRLNHPFESRWRFPNMPGSSAWRNWFDPGFPFLKTWSFHPLIPCDWRMIRGRLSRHISRSWAAGMQGKGWIWYPAWGDIFFGIQCQPGVPGVATAGHPTGNGARWGVWSASRRWFGWFFPYAQSLIIWIHPHPMITDWCCLKSEVIDIPFFRVSIHGDTVKFTGVMPLWGMISGQVT